MVSLGSAFSYLAYGLRIRAAMPLPELVAGDARAEEEVRILFGSGLRPSREGLQEGWEHHSPSPGEDNLYWRGVGTFLVREGEEIVVDPSPAVDERMLRLFILGPVMAVLLRQRGHLLLHASAVSVAGGAVLFLGSSGWGKSTTAAALHARGHGLISDDVAVLRLGGERPAVFPGFPQLKLWPEALVSLGEDPEGLPRWNPNLEKRTRSTGSDGFSSEPVAVERIYVLDGGETTEILPLRPQAAFVELVRHTYGSDYGLQSALGVGGSAHFLQCAGLLDAVPVRRLKRRKSLARLPELARLVEEDLPAVPGSRVRDAI